MAVGPMAGPSDRRFRRFRLFFDQSNEIPRRSLLALNIGPYLIFSLRFFPWLWEQLFKMLFFLLQLFKCNISLVISPDCEVVSDQVVDIRKPDDHAEIACAEPAKLRSPVVATLSAKQIAAAGHNNRHGGNTGIKEGAKCDQWLRVK